MTNYLSESIRTIPFVLRAAHAPTAIRAPGGIGVNGHPRTAGSTRSSFVLGVHYASRMR